MLSASKLIGKSSKTGKKLNCKDLESYMIIISKSKWRKNSKDKIILWKYHSNQLLMKFQER